MKKQFLLILAMASLTALSVAQSPPPPPTPAKASQEKQDNRSLNNSPASNTNRPSQTPTATVHQATPTPAQKEARKQGTINSNVSTFDWGRLNTGLLTVFNLLLVVIGFLQWNSMKAALSVSIEAARAAQYSSLIAKEVFELTERNTYLTQRALILLENVKPASPIVGKDVFHVNHLSILVFTLKNYGATVAHNVEVKGEVIILSDAKFPLCGGHKMTIAPQGTNQWITHSLGSKVNGLEKYEALNGITDPTALIYRVEVTYDDVFGKSHSYVTDGQYIAIIKDFITGNNTSD